MTRFARWTANVALASGAFLSLVAAIAYFAGNDLWHLPLTFGGLLAFGGLAYRLAYLFCLPGEE